MIGVCRICGKMGEGEAFSSWVKDTFTNYDLLHPGEIICGGCLFWFDQRSTELQTRIGKEKPQKMQNYSHFIKAGLWTPVSKGNKALIRELLVTPPFPELAAIADSGQKHLAFRARRNPAGQTAGWVQFEEAPIYVEPDKLLALLTVVEALYTLFSKGEIATGQYYPARILRFGVDRWYGLEQCIKPVRSTGLFQLALYLAQRSDDDRDTAGNGSNPAKDHLAGDTGRLQEPLPHDDMGSVRERNPGGELHQQPGEIHQLDLFSLAGGAGPDRGGAGGGGIDPEIR